MDAAKALAVAFGIVVDDTVPAGPSAKPKPIAHDLEYEAEQHYAAHWSALCDEVHEAHAVLERLHALGQADWDNPIFVSALRLCSAADERLDAIKGYDVFGKIQMYREGMMVHAR